MKAKRKQQAAAPEPARTVKLARPLRHKIGQALRDMAVDEGAVSGRWDGLAERAQERWCARADVLIERAAKLGVRITDQDAGAGDAAPAKA